MCLCISLIPDIRPPARRGCAPPPGLGFAFAPGVRGAITQKPRRRPAALPARTAARRSTMGAPALSSALFLSSRALARPRSISSVGRWFPAAVAATEDAPTYQAILVVEADLVHRLPPPPLLLRRRAVGRRLAALLRRSPQPLFFLCRGALLLLFSRPLIPNALPYI